ncbi:GLPGLI family protein [Litoribacter ruber]|uniref:GLPGLI family protein n=1 Tax=Litoribacter ruber TaxID=702568 RepID=A0AAP2CGA0_9BACT|nr:MULTISPECIES: GLPGLI family protein [Litoribacter]MBS9524098.1 GLPGLI family protein [Litoribacter alkaliphilus]MBT0811318.1 GLPGLI family protein [Litoribacter ruber]
MMFTFIIHLLLAYFAVEPTLSSSNMAVYYQLVYVDDTLSMESPKTEFMVLLVGEQQSLFKSYNKYLQDSLIQAHSSSGTTPKEFFELKKQYPNSNFDFQIVKNTRSIKVYDKIIPDHYVYEKDMSGLEWEITGDKKTLMGFTVQKAKALYGGRVWEAWFSEDLPLNDGPYVFGGLPGLVIEVKDSQGHYAFNLYKIKKGIKSSLEPYLVKKPIVASEKQFLRLRKEFHLQASQKLSQSNMEVRDIELARQVDERFRRKSNFIEVN